MKKIFVPAFAAALIVCLAGCTKAEEVRVESTGGAMTGGWELTAQKEAALPAEVSEAFDKALEGKKDGIVPVAFVGEQVVAGMNYMILCADVSGGKTTGYRMIVIYRDLQGNATLTGDTPFDLTKYTNGSDKPSDEMLAGGWNTPEEMTSGPLDDDAGKAFDKAAEAQKENVIEPIAVLGTQVVAGRNYAILCRVVPESGQGVSSVMIATIYADLQGGAEFTGFSAIDRSEFNR